MSKQAKSKIILQELKKRKVNQKETEQQKLRMKNKKERERALNAKTETVILEHEL